MYFYFNVKTHVDKINAKLKNYQNTSMYSKKNKTKGYIVFII